MWFHWDHHGWGVGWWLGHGGMSQESHLCDDQDGNVAILNSQLFECTGILKFIQIWYIYIYMWDETVWCNDRHTTGWMVTPDEASNSQAAHGPGGHHLFFCGEEQPILETKPDTEKTRCSPRTRNKLFEQSCTFPPVTVQVHCKLWNVEKGGVQSAECEESGVLSGKCSV